MGNLSTYTYDGLGNKLTEKDPNGNQTKYSYNELGWLMTVTSPKNGNTSYTYDLMGNRLVASQQEYDTSGSLSRNIAISTKAYDELGRELKDTDALGKTETTVYDGNGNPTTVTDRNGGTLTMTYDAMNRITARNGKTVSGTADNATSWDYTKLFSAKTLTVTHNGRATTDIFNPNGTLKSEAVDGKTTSYAYDLNNNRTQLTDPFGLAVTYTYDKLNRLGTVKAGTNTFTYGYYGDGKLKSLLYPNGTTANFAYNNQNQLTSLNDTVGGTAVANSYGYDANGNITSLTEAGATTGCTYDSEDRLLTSTQGTNNLTYTYDARGNRTSLSGNIPDSIANTGRDASRNFTWDSLNQLGTFKSGDGTTVKTSATYSYNQDGLRYQKTVTTTTPTANSITTKYFYDDGGRTIDETNGSNVVQSEIVWGHKPLMRIYGGKCYYHYNGHGDVTSLTDTTGKAVNTYSYDLWGNITAKTETISNPIRYAGEYQDNESGLYYLRARYYDPVVGRFISRDSYEGKVTNPLSLNLYTYCTNDPLIYVDPTGHESYTIMGLSNRSLEQMPMSQAKLPQSAWKVIQYRLPALLLEMQ